VLSYLASESKGMMMKQRRPSSQHNLSGGNSGNGNGCRHQGGDGDDDGCCEEGRKLSPSSNGGGSTSSKNVKRILLSLLRGRTYRNATTTVAWCMLVTTAGTWVVLGNRRLRSGAFNRYRFSNNKSDLGSDGYGPTSFKVSFASNDSAAAIPSSTAWVRKKHAEGDGAQQRQLYSRRQVAYDFTADEVRAAKVSSENIEFEPAAGHELSTEEEEEPKEACTWMHKWQTDNYVLCNPIHEIDMAFEAVDGALAFIACGGDRCAFRVKDIDRTRWLALKTRRHNRQFTKSNYEAGRKDGMVMERLSKSPYVLSTYGYCGLSQVLEFAEGGSTHDLIRRSRMELKKGSDALLLSPLDKLKVAIQLVTSVADMHDASITHNDLCCHQYVLVDGIYKLNDFHLSKFLKRDTETGEVCRNAMSVSTSWNLIHAPEEMDGYNKVDNKKADDYVVGNVMYYVLTNKWIYEDEPKSKNAVKLLKKGERSPFPDEVVESDDPATRALVKGIEMSWTHDVDERPTSRQVSEFLLGELERITGEDGYVDGSRVVRAVVPPLPQDWDYREDPSFNDNFN